MLSSEVTCLESVACHTEHHSCHPEHSEEPRVTMTKPNYWVYILLCENNSYYTGYTNDLAKRYQSHIEGTGKCKYTRSFKPVSIAQCWKITGSKSLAMQLEREIKKLSRTEKEKLISNPKQLSPNTRVKPTKPTI